MLCGAEEHDGGGGGVGKNLKASFDGMAAKDMSRVPSAKGPGGERALIRGRNAILDFFTILPQSAALKSCTVMLPLLGQALYNYPQYPNYSSGSVRRGVQARKRPATRVAVCLATFYKRGTLRVSLLPQFSISSQAG